MTIFFRLLASDDKAAALAQTVDALAAGETAPQVYTVNPASFRQVPGAPFAYWVSEKMRRIFTESPKLESKNRHVQFGASTKNDFRFLRAWWEVGAELSARSRESTLGTGRWVPFEKGGSQSSFYRDWELVIDWRNDGEVIKKEVAEYRDQHGWGYSWSASLNGHSFYFQPGLAWARRSQLGLSFRILQKGCIFGDKGPSIFSSGDSLLTLLALINSKPFLKLVSLQMAFGSYEVGVIQRTPVPNLNNAEGEKLRELSLACVELKRNPDTANETSHVFQLPFLLRGSGNTLAVRHAALQARVDDAAATLAAHQQEIDDLAFRLYSIAGADRQAMEESLGAGAGTEAALNEADTGEEEAEAETLAANGQALAHDLLSYVVGCAFGRWDVRYATGAGTFPPLLDPFAPLPVCSPAMLQGADGLPLLVPPPDYPLAVDADGILVDDPDHPDDLLRRVRDVLGLIWGAQADTIENELAVLLGVKDLRDYLRRGFFEAHLKRYSKSRRKAPIYWLLQSPRRGYGLWIYYHRLDHDTLYKALTGYVDPTLVREENRRETLRAEQAAAGSAGPAAKRVALAVDRQESLLADLREFRDRLAQAANHHLTPDLNDGVLLTIAPLHALVPWKDPRTAWAELLAGKYAWSSISVQLHAAGLVKA